jgi:hypothetical protein
MDKLPAGEQLCYVYKWIRVQHAVLFRLSTAVIQTIFFDNTEIYICTDTKLVTYKSKTGQVGNMTMQEVFEIEKRIDGPGVRKKGDF